MSSVEVPGAEMTPMITVRGSGDASLEAGSGGSASGMCPVSHDASVAGGGRCAAHWPR